MKPVTQTRFGRPLGNCWAAAIASILELPLEAVDWSTDMTAEEIELADGSDVTAEWKARQDARLHELGYWMARQAFDPSHVMPEGVHYLVLGYTAKGVGHVCVGREGAIVHNPNPDSRLTTLVTIDQIAFMVRR